MAFSKTAGDTALGCDTEKEDLCAACKMDGEYRAAVKYCLDCNQPICQTCVDSHRRIKQIQSHKLVDNKATDAVKIAQILSSCLACPKHPDKTIEFICVDHDVFFCSTCATVNHRGCHQVKEVATESQSAQVSMGVQTLAQHILDAKSHIENIVAAYQKHIAQIQLQMSKNIPKQIQDMKASINKTFDELEKLFRKETNSLGIRKITAGKSEVDKWESLISTIKENAKLLAVAHQNGSEIHQFVAMINVRKFLAEEVTNLSQTKQLNLENLTFSFEKDTFLKHLGINVNNIYKPLNDIDPDSTARKKQGQTAAYSSSFVSKPSFSMMQEYGYGTPQTSSGSSSSAMLEFKFGAPQTSSIPSSPGMHEFKYGTPQTSSIPVPPATQEFSSWTPQSYSGPSSYVMPGFGYGTCMTPYDVQKKNAFANLSTEKKVVPVPQYRHTQFYTQNQ